MHRQSPSLALIAALVLSLPAVAGAQEEEPTTFVYATYFVCDVTKQDRVDDIVKNAYAPAYDAAVEAGTISSWGWMAHHTGNQWRRLLYYSAPGLDALFAAPDAINPTIDEAHPSANLVFGEICNQHEDYIWEVDTGSAGAGLISEARSDIGISVYDHCTMSDEERADEIVESSLAPIFNKHVKAGHTTSWGWLKHYFGGKWRRVATMTAPDVKTLCAGRDAIFEDIAQQAEAASKEFGGICGSHQDMLWEIVHEKP